MPLHCIDEATTRQQQCTRRARVKPTSLPSTKRRTTWIVAEDKGSLMLCDSVPLCCCCGLTSRSAQILFQKKKISNSTVTGRKIRCEVFVAQIDRIEIETTTRVMYKDGNLTIVGVVSTRYNAAFKLFYF